MLWFHTIEFSRKTVVQVRSAKTVHFKFEMEGTCPQTPFRHPSNWLEKSFDQQAKMVENSIYFWLECMIHLHKSPLLKISQKQKNCKMCMVKTEKTAGLLWLILSPCLFTFCEVPITFCWVCATRFQAGALYIYIYLCGRYISPLDWSRLISNGFKVIKK